jgi:hypothetical protein
MRALQVEGSADIEACGTADTQEMPWPLKQDRSQ